MAHDQECLFVYEGLARAAGFDVELATDGFEAMLLAYLARPDAMVIDTRHRPIEDSRRTLRRLQCGVYTRSLPVVLVGPSTTEPIGEAGCAARAEEPREAVMAVKRLLA